MKRLLLVLLSIWICMSCIGCGERDSQVQTIPKPTLVYPINGDGLSKEHPIYTTIEELNAEPEKYEEKWVFFQAYIEDSLDNPLQNKHVPLWIDNQINPDVQYIIVQGTKSEQAWDHMSKISSYAGTYATEAVVQVKGYYRKEYLERLGEEVYCICVDEVYLTDWIDDGYIPQGTPPPNKVEPTQREIVGEGTMEAPFQITIGELKQRPEQYDEKWVEFDAYLYCEKSGQGGQATLLQEYEEETTENRDKIGMVLTEYDDGYDEMKELVEEALRENKTIKVRVKGMFELNPYELKGDVAEKTQFLSMQTFRRIE